MCRGELTSRHAACLLPERATLGMVWRYLAGANTPLQESPICLCRKIVRWSGKALDLGQLLICLDIFADVGLVELQRQHKYITIRLAQIDGKADLTRSRTMQVLLQAKES
jgi:hypothetical protein